MVKSKFSGLFDAAKARVESPVEKRGRGRPRGSVGGKRDDDDYTQASAYVRKETHRRVKAALILEEKEFSELIEELLTEWLNSRS